MYEHFFYCYFLKCFVPYLIIIYRLQIVLNSYVEIQGDVVFDYVFVDEESFEKYRPSSFGELVKIFTEYK